MDYNFSGELLISVRLEHGRLRKIVSVSSFNSQMITAEIDRPQRTSALQALNHRVTVLLLASKTTFVYLSGTITVPEYWCHLTSNLVPKYWSHLTSNLVPKYWCHLTSNLVPKYWCHLTSNLVPKYWCHLQYVTASGPNWHQYSGTKARSASFGLESDGEWSQMAAVFWNKIEERLFEGAEVITIYVSFQQVPLVEFSSTFLCSTPRG